MKSLICDRLARVASVAAQDRYITNGTPEEYYLPEELLEDVSELHELARTSSDLTLDERKAVESFQHILQSQWVSGPAPEFLSPQWCVIRDAARQCLIELDYDLLEWERRESC